MRCLLIFLSVLLWASCNVSVAQAGVDVWTSNGPEGGIIDTLAIDPQNPSVLYAGTGSDYANGIGVFKSIDGGASWSSVNTGLTSLSVYVLAIDPQTPSTIYAGTRDGIFKSTNGGGNWSTVNTGLQNLDVRALAIDPQTPGTIYAGTLVVHAVN